MVSELVSDTFFFTLKVTLKLIYFKDKVRGKYKYAYYHGGSAQS